MHRLSQLRRFPVRMILLLACLVCYPPAARSQTGIYATFDASNFQTPNVGEHYGPTFGIYHDMWHAPLLRAGVDARAMLLGGGSTEAYSGLFGPTVQLRLHAVPLKPYVEGLIGAGHVNAGQGVATIDTTAFAYAGVIGLDWTMLPRLDWRVVEFSAEGFSNLNGNVSPKTWSTGVVLRIP
jgi:hypothetical protein